MKTLRGKKLVAVVCVVFFVLAGYLIYSRPMTIAQLYPMLMLDQCSGISGYYRTTAEDENVPFTIEKDSEAYQKLCALFYEQEYRRSLRDMFSRGTRIHKQEPGDYQWDVYFSFEDVVFPDGSIGSGKILHVSSWYGELDLYVDGETHSCFVREQEHWAKEVLDTILDSVGD